MKANMSDSASVRNCQCQGGFTLLEVLIVLMLVVFLVAVIANLTISAGDSQKYSERMARATEVNQEIIYDLRSELLAAVSLFQSGTLGEGYFAALETDPLAPPLSSAKLPSIILTGTFGKETSPGALTGNVLMFAGQAWTTEFSCTSTNTYLVDVYRITCYYLSKEDGGPRLGSPIGLNLTKFVSEPLADADQIEGITDLVDRNEVLTHMFTASADVTGMKHSVVKLVWKRGRDIAEPDALREIDPSTGMLSSTPIPPRQAGTWRILREPRKSACGLLHYRHFSAASNYGTRRLGVARFGMKSDVGDGFPHGFEVQVAGPSSARQVLVHLSIVGTNRKGTKAHSDLRATVLVQDV